MTDKKRQNKPRLSAVVIEARAGLIPESDDIEDERRARMDRTIRVVRILKANARLPTCGSEGQAITDLIADLRHYCHWSGIPFHNFYRAANALYLEEKDELGKSPRPSGPILICSDTERTFHSLLLSNMGPC